MVLGREALVVRSEVQGEVSSGREMILRHKTGRRSSDEFSKARNNGTHEVLSNCDSCSLHDSMAAKYNIIISTTK